MKARNPGNTVVEINSVLDLPLTSDDLYRPLMTSNDLQIENVITMALCISNES